MSDSRKPKLVPSQLPHVRLSKEERFLVARIDGSLSLDDLAILTGLLPSRIDDLVTGLAAQGAVTFGVAAPPPPPPPPTRDFVESHSRDVVEKVEDESGALEENRLEESAPDEESAVDDEKAAPAEDRNYHHLFETIYHPLTVGDRVTAARTAKGADLCALCFDPDPQVVAAVLENPTTGLDQARLLAAHHRTGTGLEIVTRRADFVRDGIVERRLLRNPMVGELVLGRVMGTKRLLPTYKIAIDRDVPEVSRVKCRGYLRQKWQTAPPEERAELLLRTEARCLVLMSGTTFDAKTTGILCGRPINSVMFVQSIAKFGASPPSLLAHLYKQPFVRKNAPLRKLLLAHPNMPGDVKRSL